MNNIIVKKDLHNPKNRIGGKESVDPLLELRTKNHNLKNNT